MGIFWDFVVSMCKETFPPKPAFTLDDVPDLSGKVVLVTGGNSGLGLETTKVLINHGAKVYMAARDKTKALEAVEEVKKATGREPIFIQLDLADLDSVQAAAQTFLKDESRLDILYNSGGVMIPPIAELTKQGYDLQFGVNVLGHFYLTKLLLPVLTSTTQLDPHAPKVRVITVSSGAHHLSGISYDCLKDTPQRSKMTPETLYAQSKYADVVFARELARRYGDKGIVSIGLNPGNIKTNLQRRVTGVQKSMISFMLYPVVPNGIITHLWAGTAKETEEYNGKYLIPFARVGTPRKDTQDNKIGEDLWKWLEEQVAGR